MGASPLAAVAATATPPKALQEFGANRGQVLKLWIAESENPAQHVGLLAILYAEEFAREFRLYETPTDAESLPDDMRLVGPLVRVGRADALISVIELAFCTADERVRAALEGGTLQNPPPRNAGEFASYFQPAMWLANFGLIWIREIARLAPASKPRLLETLSRAHVFNFFTFFGPALGYRHYHMSSYYEDESDYLSAQYDKLYKELKDATSERPRPAGVNTGAPVQPAPAPPAAARPSRVQPAPAAPAPKQPTATQTAAAQPSATRRPASPPAPTRPETAEVAAGAGPGAASKSAVASPLDLPTWLLNSGEDLGRRGEVLAAWYESELTRDDFAEGKTFGSELGEVDKRAISGLAKSRRNDCLARVAHAAFTQALRRFEASAASMSRERRYTDEERRRLTLELERSCRRASFGLEWCKAAASVSAECRRELRSMLEDQNLAPYFYFLGWLDVADGCGVLGIDSYYEFMSASIRLRRSELCASS
ncbi:hypothetical protein SAMN05444161_7524 [Rhizobiales bacterium GAS191]|nr:hypothetical protein SAMN05444161_7524 [Rhizobiales bacterium GAS191]